MYSLRFIAYNGLSHPPDSDLTLAEARHKAAQVLRRKRRRGLTVTTLSPGEEWEMQWSESGVSDSEGWLKIQHRTFECRECGCWHETKDDAAACCQPSED